MQHTQMDMKQFQRQQRLIPLGNNWQNETCHLTHLKVYHLSSTDYGQQESSRSFQ